MKEQSEPAPSNIRENTWRDLVPKSKPAEAQTPHQSTQAPVTPVFMHGLGKVLPKGTWLPVPFNCDIYVGDAFYGREDIDGFMDELSARMHGLAGEGSFPSWEDE